MSSRPYTVELHLSRSGDDSTREGVFDLELVDQERTSTRSRPGVGIAFLDLRRQSIPDLGLVDAFLKTFLRGDGGTQEDGLLFGRHLLDRLLGDADVRVFWEEVQTRRKAEKRPLRLELLLPPDDAGVVSDIPFELLADDSGFLFRQVGATLVRAIRRLPVRGATIEPGDAVMVAWANPKVENRLPQAMFDQHEERTRGAAEEIGLIVRAPCRQATRMVLEKRLVEGGGTQIVSLIAHGDEPGGAALLHGDGHPAYPDDPGHPVEARDLAASFRKGKVCVALLWTCHSGKHNAISGALASTLLDPDHGDLAAVVAAHAALRAESTAPMVARLLGSLRAPAGGDLERAVGEARLALAATDLQWAAPVYYARPSGGQSVMLAEAVEKAAESLRVPEVAPAGEVERAPGRWPHFRGRDDEIARGMAYLRTGRLVSVTGMAGMGKTEVALEIAREAAKDAELGLKRVIWFPLDGMRQAEALRATLAVAFGAEAKDCPDDAALARRIGDARALVVLDNAEDPIRSDRGGMWALVDTLLRVCSGLKIALATRERLGDVRAAEEHEVHVEKLGERDAREVFVSVAAERLLPVERDSQELGRLLTWLDGHPLSLVLVARQVGTMSLAALLRRLEKRGAEAVQVDELFGEEIGADQDERLRKERLVSSLNLSYLPLAEKAPGAAEMFVWLGYFPAGLPGVLVPYVFGEEGEENRAVLLRKGMAEEVGRERRLVLPAPVRAYARVEARKIGEGRRGELLAASFGAMAGWLGVLYARLGKPGAREAMDSGAREAENLRTLLMAARALPGAAGGDGLGEAIAGAVTPFALVMQHAGRAELGVEIAREALAFTERLAHGAPVANVLQALGDLYVRTDRLKEAEAAYDKALPQYRAIDDRLGEANVLQALGDLYVRTDRLKDAEAAYDKALPQYRAIDERLGEASVLKALGDLYVRTDRLKDAEAAYAKALTQFRAIDERLSEAKVLAGLGSLALEHKDPAQAFLRYLEALSLQRQVDNALGVAAAHLFLSRASRAAGKPLRAAALLAHSIRFYASLDDHFDLVLSLLDLAGALADLGKGDAASRAALIAWSHAAAIEHPLAQHMAERTGQAEPPSAEEVEQAYELLAAALAACEDELRAAGEDPYAPLE